MLFIGIMIVNYSNNYLNYYNRFSIRFVIFLSSNNNVIIITIMLINIDGIRFVFDFTFIRDSGF